MRAPAGVVMRPGEKDGDAPARGGGRGRSAGGRFAPSARSARLRAPGRSPAPARDRAVVIAAPAIAPSKPAATPRRAVRSGVAPAPAARAAARARLAKRPNRAGQVGFAALFALVVGGMVLALVSLNALLAQASFAVDDLSSQIGALETEHLELVSEQAELSAPGRIAEWARRNGMRLPDDIRILHAPDASTAPAGAADDPGSGP